MVSLLHQLFTQPIPFTTTYPIPAVDPSLFVFSLQLQKGPVQLPAFCLAPHLSDRQQALSVNLKPSELRLSTPDVRPASPPEPGAGPPHHGGLSRSESEPAIRGILKKSRSATGAAWRPDPAAAAGPGQNGGGAEDPGDGQQQQQEEEEKKKVEVVEVARKEARPPSLPPRRQRNRGSTAPWRQRAPAETEVGGGSSERPPTDPRGLPQEEKSQQEEAGPTFLSSRPSAAGGRR